MTDWIVVGAGLAGSALGYELAKAGYSVLLLEQSPQSRGATRFSYGGIAYWSGNTPMLRQLCQESIALHRNLATELEAETQFRELELLLTIDRDRDAEAVLAAYTGAMIPPALLSVEAACALEPLLNPAAIGGALLLRHGHVSPEATVNAYNQAFLRLGGEVQMAQVQEILPDGVRLGSGVALQAANVAVCAGAASRRLLRQAGIEVPLFFTQAEIIETPPLDVQLQAMVMCAELQRFDMEAKAAQSPLWDAPGDAPGQEVVPPILDIGVVQMADRSLRIGQFTRAWTDLQPAVDAIASEAALRSGLGEKMPTLRDVPGEWRRCQVAFCGDRLPLVGAVPAMPAVHLFTGFSNPFALLPPLARRFAQRSDKPDEILAALSPARFSHC
jgi:glycine/D-amino acid oxidase-like deaminating enzyme